MGKLNFILLFFLIAGCNKDNYCDDIDGHSGLQVLNNSDKTINFDFGNYPDTVVGEYDVTRDGTDGILSGESRTRGAGRESCWEETFEDNKTEWLFIFNEDTIKTLDWSVVRATNRGVLDRRLIDLEYLQSHDFTITYP